MASWLLCSVGLSQAHVYMCFFFVTPASKLQLPWSWLNRCRHHSRKTANRRIQHRLFVLCSLSWLDEVGRDTRKCIFSFTTWAGRGETLMTDQTIYSMGYCLNAELFNTYFDFKKFTYSSFNQKQWSIFILSDTNSCLWTSIFFNFNVSYPGKTRNNDLTIKHNRIYYK